jgi:hypothetical protein
LFGGVWHADITVAGVWAVAGVTSWVALTNVLVTALSCPIVVTYTVAVHVPAGVLNTVLTV